MPYARKSRRTSRVRRSSGRDYFWAAPVQRVGRGGSNFGPYSVSRPGFTKLANSGNVAANQRVNFSNGLSRLYSAHGATSFQLEDSREARIRDRPWRIHYFEGILTVSASSRVVGNAWLAIHCTQGPAVSIPREEGSSVPSGILLPEARQSITHYFTISGPGGTGNPTTGTSEHRRTFTRMPVSKTVNPEQDWLINFEADHVEGTWPAGAVQCLAFGRFRCSRT